MQKLWFITNPASGTTTPAKAQAIEALFEERDLTLVGRTAFPDDPLPKGDALTAAGVDTVILFAGDGTINAAACALAEWQGEILILPGGTMNLLAKLLHGSTDPKTILHAAHERGRAVALPCAETDKHRALVGLILGPAASWVRARELVRDRRIRGLMRALTAAWVRTFSHGIRLAGVPGFHHRAQAVFVRPERDHLDVRAVDAREWSSIAKLGWEWLTGDWVEAQAVTRAHTAQFRTTGRKPALALFDGEPLMLEPGTVVSSGMTRRMFLSTTETAGDRG